jgi:hypothetical protein
MKLGRRSRKRKPSPGVALQQAAFEFLREKYNTQELFSLGEFQAAAGFKDESIGTYISKQFRDLLVEVSPDKYRVSLAFRLYATWPKFRDNVVTQNRILTHEYAGSSYENVVMFEFFMPLRNEESLRVALDGLFFKDSITFRLHAIDEGELKQQFPKLPSETEEQYFERICSWLADRFVGYSINPVSGRFRIGELKTRAEVLTQEANTPDRYLADETTAAVRFIFPCKGKPPLKGAPLLGGFEEALREEAASIRWFFNQLFVQSILEVVNGEDEIWLLESGMQNQLHIYKVKD